MLIRVPRETPLNVHLQVTTQCNLACQYCFYRGNGELKEGIASSLVEEWASLSVKAIAIGGGEPMLVPWLGELVSLAQGKGMFVAVTTNGSILRDDIKPDKIAVSWDRIHEGTWETCIPMDAVSWYRDLGCSVCINHVLTDAEALSTVLAVTQDVIVLLEKPVSHFTHWDEGKKLIKRLAVDSCMAKVHFGQKCYQGEISMYIDAGLRCAVCSNVPRRIDYMGLKETWNSLRKDCLYGGEKDG